MTSQILLLVALATSTPDPQALKLVDQCFAAMGGKDKLASIHQTKTEFFSHNNALEESERPEGPWVITYGLGQDTIDFDQVSISRKSKNAGLIFSPPVEGEATLSFVPTFKQTGGLFGFYSGAARRRLALGPERLLFTASAAPDLRLGQPTTFHDIPHDVLQFTWGPVPVTVFVNHYTHLPAAIQTTWVGDGYWGFWGDVTERVIFGNWDIVPGGVLFPTIWAIEDNGLRQEDQTLTSVEMGFGAPSDTAWTSTISPLTPKAPATAQFKANEIAPGIVQYLGGFNCAVVDQGDGLVVLEGVVGSSYMRAVLDDAAKRFPGKKIKAVVSTDDAWPHIAGLRTFVGQGVPIYSHVANRPILTRVFAAPYTIVPDDLARHPARPNLKLIDGRTEIGKGDNQIVLYPMHGAVTERMLFGYFPAKKLLYAPDVIQVGQGGHWFAVNTVQEMLNAVARENLAVETAFSFHSRPIPFAKMQEAVADAMKAKP